MIPDDIMDDILRENVRVRQAQMDATDRAKLEAQLVLHEGERLFAYEDTTRHVTIGVGRNISEGGKGITAEESRYLLHNDIKECEADLEHWAWYHGLDAVRKRVLLDLRFNLGPDRFRKFRRTLRLIGEGDYVGAGEAMRNSLWYRQVGTRARRLIRMMKTGEDYQ